ncbi:nucleotidyltransferase domain-containing protein [Nakamurella sp. GG22]
MTGSEPAAPESTAADVLALLDLLAAAGVVVWLDGGWGVDANLRRQTRAHADIDIVLEERDLAVAVAVLADRGYRPVPRDDAKPWNFVLGDDDGHLVDFHAIRIGADGAGRYGPPERTEDVVPVAARSGRGSVVGRAVRTISPEFQVAFHTGYQPDENDWRDVSALCATFGIAVPADYARFAGRPAPR